MSAILTKPDAPIAFHVMAKPTGAICNLDCEYCFFLSKEMLYPGSRFRMAQELQEAYIRQLLEGHRNAPEVVVAWQGGEPTMMGLDFFRRSIEIQREYARPGQRIPTHPRRGTGCSRIKRRWLAAGSHQPGLPRAHCPRHPAGLCPNLGQLPGI